LSLSQRTRRDSRESTRDALLNAACGLLTTQGLRAVTTNAVARSAGVEAALVSRWWPSEQALALDALRREWLDLATRIRHGTSRVGL
jgi:AcrR family transcriptional regulator